MVAGAAFAADVSAKVKIDGSLFAYGNDKTVSALSIKHGNESWNPTLAFSFNGEKAGATFKIYDPSCGVSENYTATEYGFSIWYKPVDILKMTVGEWSTSLNQEQIDWSHSNTAIDKNGYCAEISTNGFTFDAFLAPGWSAVKKANPTWQDAIPVSWFSKADGGDAVIADTYFKAAYSAGFGNLSGSFEMKAKDNYVFAAGYGNTFGTVNMFVNGLGTVVNGDFAQVRGELFAKTAVGGVNLATFLAGGYSLADGNNFSGWKIAESTVKDKAAFGATFKASMPVAGVTPYLYIKDGNFLADKFAIEVKPGVTGNVGEMSYEVALDINYDAAKADPESKVSVNVPVSFTVAF